MAQINPSLHNVRHDAGLFREFDVLERLRLGLPDGYNVFHSVDWHSVHNGIDHHGEIDLVVLAPNGNMLLIEVKAGSVNLRNGEIFKRYGQDRERNVAQQTRIQYSAMVNRLQEAKLFSFVTNCLVLPDYRIENEKIISIPRERIIDASEFDHLATRVRELLTTEKQYGTPTSDVEVIRRFLANEFSVSLDLSVLGQQLQETTKRLSEGLATWVPRITAPSGVVRIQATAGSGKTQLALRLLSDAAANKQRAMYVCFNRTLADHIGHFAPAQTKVASFHELCVDYYTRIHSVPDFCQSDIFQTLAQTYCDAASTFSTQHDLIVIDEGQDFEPTWVAALLPQLHPQGHLYLLEDEAQRLYGRESFDLTDSVSIVCQDNFRSPRAICTVINALNLSDHPVDARSPYTGELPGFRTYESNAELLTQTAQAVRDLQARGIALTDIVVLSGHGRQKSSLLNAHSIDDFSTRHFTGSYNKNGEQIWSCGDLLVESIYRFKGQSAAGVVISELDFASLNEHARHILFVGMTRAHLAVELVLSKSAETSLAKALG